MAEEKLAAAHIPPGAGEALWVGGEHITFKVRGAHTNGSVALIEDEVQPGYGPPLHLHLHENEAFYIVSGSFTFTLGDRTVEAPPGSLFTVPKGQLHTFHNVGAAPGRLVAMIWPAVAFEGFVTEVGTPDPPTGPPTWRSCWQRPRSLASLCHPRSLARHSVVAQTQQALSRC